MPLPSPQKKLDSKEPENRNEDELNSQTTHSSSDQYTDIPEFVNARPSSAQDTLRGFNSALTGRSAIPFSGFKTPQVASGRWSEKFRIDQSEKKQQGDILGEAFAEKGIHDVFDNYHDPYPSWSNPEEIPITRQEIELIFIELMEIFGFQLDNTKNMFDFLLRLLDSRASRMSSSQALRSLHADYIGGLNSNFKKWYFGAQLDIDDTIGFVNIRKNGTPKRKKSKKDDTNFDHYNDGETDSSGIISLEESEKRWTANMNSLSAHDSIIQISIYLLCWGESNNIRFMPECLCFIFKCCNDYYYGLDKSKKLYPDVKLMPFLDHVITPLYNYYRDQSFELVDGVYVDRDKDHSSTIGYDDMNQFFWYRKGLEKIVLKETKKQLIKFPPHERYTYLNDVKWSKCFYKTYKERRTWSHVILNFNRIWIIHISMFWIYTLINSPVLYTKNYQQQLNNKPSVQLRLSVLALNGSISTLINVVATILEYFFVPRRWPGSQSLAKRLIFLFLIFIIITSPTIYAFDLLPFNPVSQVGLGITLTQFIVSTLVSIYFAVTPIRFIFGSFFKSKQRRDHLPNQNFTNSIHKLSGKSALSSYGLWFTVFTAKFIESYFFLTLSLKDPIRELSIIKINKCVGEVYIGNFVCQYLPKVLLVLMCLTDLVLFFLDTYLWYIVCNTFHSVCRSLYIGVSIWTPWRNIFSRLPKRIYSKIIAASPENQLKSKVLVSQVWNSIVISMYREHLLSLEHVRRLIYQQVVQDTVNGGQSTFLKEPAFFISQEDSILKSPLFESQSEAQRRINFFAQSLSTPMPDPVAVTQMPTFTVLIPHFSEKITLTLREIIREDEGYSNVTLLEYLKQLHPQEWNCFVQDTKMLAEENELDYSTNSGSTVLCSSKEKADNLPFYCVGFKAATPEYIMRTRIWASLRSQTLFRTITGFMNYSRAVKLMFDLENPLNIEETLDENKRLEDAAVMALRKFRMVVSMQRMTDFSADEQENKELLLRVYPELQIAYLEEEITETGERVFYSSLVDGGCEIMEDGKRRAKYRIRLSGNPILGDGKSDNQNHALVFCRGEYIQLIDANQDNYLEECLKIRSVLAEFEEDEENQPDIYEQDSKAGKVDPVAIIGTREYIFSENIGILGDVAAGKEQTFGTLFARTLARIGGKLHYGHPDFLNTIFMTTRGGVSKAQKGLHLNEDIYAGINAVLRGGRIKHSEYIQCGKGRDLGFGSILNFNTKIGAGMGEQMLSREYFYLGTQLPLDRFLSFYYAHPGFHLNNVFIIFSLQLFLIVSINLASLVHETIICDYNPNVPITDSRKPAGCSNFIPLIKWLERSVLSIFIVFSVSFVPLCVQELTERGIWRAFTRLTKHFMSLSPLFEIFVCKIYARSLISDLSVGGARYIATGRGFATVRVPFNILYSRFAFESFYFGLSALAMLLYSSTAMWNIVLLYFWFTISALLVSPFLYNPNQFSWSEFFMDYKAYLQWLSSGNIKGSGDSWISHVRSIRIQITGSKRRQIGKEGDKISSIYKRPSFMNMFFSQIFVHLFLTFSVLSAYLFANSQNESRSITRSNSLLRLLVCSFGPIIVNMAVLLVFFVISVVVGPLVTLCIPGFPSFLSSIVHSFALISHFSSFELLWFFQNWNFKNTVLGFYVCALVQGLLFKLIIIIFLTREFRHDRSNRAWWSGKWATAGLGWKTFTQPGRELLCKVIEMSMFAVDFTLGHFILMIQLPILLIPYVDKWHTLLLFWLKPDRQIRPQILSSRKRRKRRLTVYFYTFLFLCVTTLFVSLLMVPFILNNILKIDIERYVPHFLNQLIQPNNGASSKIGLKAYSLMKQKTRQNTKL